VLGCVSEGRGASGKARGQAMEPSFRDAAAAAVAPPAAVASASKQPSTQRSAKCSVQSVLRSTSGVDSGRERVDGVQCLSRRAKRPLDVAGLLILGERDARVMLDLGVV
jgi:hypothetical protein